MSVAPSGGAPDADDLMTGPRGRTLLLGLVSQQADPGDWLPGAHVFTAEAALDSSPGVRYLREVDGAGEDAGEVPVPDEEWSDEPQLGLDEMIARVGDSLASTAMLDRLRRITPVDLVEAMADVVSAARYWQEPSGRQLLAARAELQSGLRRVAQRICADPRLAWWAAPMDRDDQLLARTWDTAEVGRAIPRDEVVTDSAELLRRWRMPSPARRWWQRRAPSQVNQHFDDAAVWWSTPPYGLAVTTRALVHGAPARLWWREDDLGPDRAGSRRVRVPADARVLEIGTEHDWIDLCRRFPLEVTASRAENWRLAVGAHGRLVIPDWAAVAQHHDAVHLSAVGYLRAAGRALTVDLPDGAATTVLAGFSPDETWWLTDRLTPTGPISTWAGENGGAWRPGPVGSP